MPKRYTKRYVKRGATSTRKRRLQGRDDFKGNLKAAYGSLTAKPTARPVFKKGNLRGRNPYDSVKRRGAIGKAVPTDAASGGRVGHSVGTAKKMGTIIAKRRMAIQNILADNTFPVIKDHRLEATTQIDWVSGTQAYNEYSVGYQSADLSNMLNQSSNAQSTAIGSQLSGGGTGVITNQRMDIYDKITKMNFKNTCSHTVYLEFRAYVAASNHSFNFTQSWQGALDNDNMLQNAATFGIEEQQTTIDCRPDMRLAELNVRWRERKEARWKVVLEPGQETSYRYVAAGRRFDQQKFNVTLGDSASAVDPINIEGLSHVLTVFSRAEMVADSLDTDVTYGSGHIATNREVWKSWSAVPYVKPLQTSHGYQWGSVIEANELDLNQYQANNDIYEELV